MSLKCGHVRWAFDLSAWRPSISDLLIATSCIQEEEKLRLAKFVFREDFNASLIGRLMMRCFVQKATNCDYNAIKFDRDERGKPFLVEPKNLRLDFNVSHQGKYSVLAGTVGTNAKIGVDTMKIEYTGGKSLEEFFRLMTRNFSDSEWGYIKSRDTKNEQLEAFMRNWCLKESYVKNIGVGITVDLRNISFKINSSVLEVKQPVTDTTLTVDGNLVTNWTFHESLIDYDHCVAVAIDNPEENSPIIPFEIIDFPFLVENYKELLPKDEIYCKKVLEKEYKNRK